jgi:hypothetical protein
MQPNKQTNEKSTPHIAIDNLAVMMTSPYGFPERALERGKKVCRH